LDDLSLRNFGLKEGFHLPRNLVSEFGNVMHLMRDVMFIVMYFQKI